MELCVAVAKQMFLPVGALRWRAKLCKKSRGKESNRRSLVKAATVALSVGVHNSSYMFLMTEQHCNKVKNSKKSILHNAPFKNN